MPLTSVSYLFLSLSLIKSDLVKSLQLANMRFSRFCEVELSKSKTLIVVETKGISSFNNEQFHSCPRVLKQYHFPTIVGLSTTLDIGTTCGAVLKCLYGQQGFYSYGSSILCKKVF